MVRAGPSSPPAERGRAPEGEDAVLEALRAGDEYVFAHLVRRWGGVMLELALVHVRSRAVAADAGPRVTPGAAPALTRTWFSTRGGSR